MIIHVDNQGAMILTKNRETSNRSKHMDLIYHMIPVYNSKVIFRLSYISTEHKVADIFIKALD